MVKAQSSCRLVWQPSITRRTEEVVPNRLNGLDLTFLNPRNRGLPILFIAS